MKSKKQSGPKVSRDLIEGFELIDLLMRTINVQARAIESLAALYATGVIPAETEPSPAAETAPGS